MATRRAPCAPLRVFATMRTFGITQTAFGWRETWIDARRTGAKVLFFQALGRVGRRDEVITDTPLESRDAKKAMV